MAVSMPRMGDIGITNISVTIAYEQKCHIKKADTGFQRTLFLKQGDVF
jgi:hypothetical protein